MDTQTCRRNLGRTRRLAVRGAAQVLLLAALTPGLGAAPLPAEGRAPGGELLGAASIQALVALVDDPDAGHWAARAIAYLRHEGSPGPLNLTGYLLMPRSRDVEARVSSWRDDPSSKLQERLEEADPVSREAAVLVLARTCEAHALGSLAGKAADAAASVRRAIVAALGVCGDHHAFAYLEHSAWDEDATVRASAIGALGALGDPRGLSLIAGALADRDPSVRILAIVSVMKLEMARRRGAHAVHGGRP
jgi:hypothetical protein